MRGSRVFAWGSWPNCQKTALTTLFSSLYIHSFTEGVQWLFQRKVLFSKVPEGVQLFSGGGGGSNFFNGGGGGPKANFNRNPYYL